MKQHIKKNFELYLVGLIIIVLAFIFPDFEITLSGGFAWIVVCGLLFFLGYILGAIFEMLSWISMKLWNKRQK